MGRRQLVRPVAASAPAWPSGASTPRSARGPLTLQVGKQFVRWGKTDILNPTDRFAPRDYLTVVDNEFLGVTAARFTAGLQSDTLDLVAARFTPSRTPLLDQRWAGLGGRAGERRRWSTKARTYPGRTQLGARWNHVGIGYEFSLSGFSGNNNLPLIEAGAPQLPEAIPVPPAASLPAQRRACRAAGSNHPRLSSHVDGRRAMRPCRCPSFTLKGEAAFFGTSDSRADQYWLYVIQVERQSGRVDLRRRLLGRGRDDGPRRRWRSRRTGA